MSVSAKQLYKLVHENLVETILAGGLNGANNFHIALKSNYKVVLVAHLKKLNAIHRHRNIHDAALTIDAQFHDQ